MWRAGECQNELSCRGPCSGIAHDVCHPINPMHCFGGDATARVSLRVDSSSTSSKSLKAFTTADALNIKLNIRSAMTHWVVVLPH
jgi:hypothetical protein